MLIRIGALSPLLNLDDVLRERHEDIRAQRQRTIDKRVAKGIPLDDDTKWSNIDTLAIDKALAAHDTAGVQVAAQAVLDAVAVNKLEPFAEYVSVPHYAGIKIQFRALAHTPMRKLLDVIASAQGTDAVAEERFHEAIGAYVKEAVHVINFGDEQLIDIDDNDVQSLLASGLLIDVFVAARDYQALSLGKDSRFGLPAPQT